MQEKRPYNQPHVTKRRRVYRQIHYNRIIIAICIVCVIAAFLVVFFSTTTGRIKIKKQSFYFVCASKHMNYEDAVMLGESLKKAGGAGYILNDNEFNVMASVYLKEADANSVLPRLKEAGFENASIYILDGKNVTINKFDDAILNEKINEFFMFIPQTLLSLYNLIIEYDLQKTTEAVVHKTLENKLNEVRRYIAELGGDVFSPLLKERGEVFTEVNFMYLDILGYYTDVFDAFSYEKTASLIKKLECQIAISYNKCINNIKDLS